MKKAVMIFIMIPIVMLSAFETDTLATDAGDLKITFIGHGTLYFEFNDIVIHADPWSRLTDYSQLPKADIILVTHQHGDHLDVKAIDAVRKEKTAIFIRSITQSAPMCPQKSRRWKTSSGSIELENHNPSAS